MLAILLWIMAAVQVFGVWATVYMIGKPRIPLTAGTGAITVLLTGSSVVILVLAAIALS